MVALGMPSFAFSTTVTFYSSSAGLRWLKTMVVAYTIPSPLAPGANSKFWDSLLGMPDLASVQLELLEASILHAQRVLTDGRVYS